MLGDGLRDVDVEGTGQPNPKDLLSTLCGLAMKGVDIEIYIDDGTWESFPFVKQAASQLVKAGCKVYTQTPVLVVNGGNEAIQHDKLILATLHSGVCRTMIGSAGFTRDVIANNNWENFICTDVQGVYDSLMAHHLRTLDSKVATTFRILPPKTEPSKKVCGTPGAFTPRARASATARCWRPSSRSPR